MKYTMFASYVFSLYCEIYFTSHLFVFGLNATNVGQSLQDYGYEAKEEAQASNCYLFYDYKCLETM